MAADGLAPNELQAANKHPAGSTVTGQHIYRAAVNKHIMFMEVGNPLVSKLLVGFVFSRRERHL